MEGDLWVLRLSNKNGFARGKEFKQNAFLLSGYFAFRLHLVSRNFSKRKLAF